MFKVLALLGFLGFLLAFYFSEIYYTFQYTLTPRKSGSNELFTPEELELFDGVQSPLLYLAILGTVFNVTDGSKHYGVGQQYHFFVGKDASRSFVTGKFEKTDKTDDVSSLNQQELKTLNSWLKFYRKEYKKVGKLIGRYYDEFGRLTPYARQMKRLIKEAEQKEENTLLEKQVFPPCNVEWDAEKGSRVWCTRKSGGIERPWAGKPRQYYEAGSKTFRCACITKENARIGTIKEYPGCVSDSDSCFVKAT